MIKYYIGFFLILLIKLCLVTTQSNYCIDLKPQTALDIEQLMGIWHGIEIIHHLDRHETAETEIDEICPVIFISEKDIPTTTEKYNQNEYTNYRTRYQYTTASYDSNRRNNDRQRATYDSKWYQKQQRRNLSLLWEDSFNTIEYSLKFDPMRPGFWISSGPQNGSMLERKFNSFAGHIQVLKAVGTHLVLTFCHLLPNNELFTILLSRDLYLSPQDISGIHNLLSRRGLSSYKVRKVCTNGANNSKYITSASLILLVILFIF